MRAGKQTQDAKKVDWLGTILIAISLLGISFGLIQEPTVGWNTLSILLSLIGGATMLIGFILFESRTAELLVPLFLFKNPLVAGANLITLFLYTALQGLIFLLVLNLQQVQDMTPIQAGLALLPPIILITFLSGPGGRLSDKIGPRIPLVIGPAIVAAGIALLILPGVGANYFTQFLPGLVLFGLGMSFVVAPLTKSALSVAAQYSGVASGINNGIARIAALLAVALFGAIIASIFINQLTTNLQNSNLSAEQQHTINSQASGLGNITIPTNFNTAAYNQADRAIKESFVHGFRWVMGISALLAIISALLANFTIHQPKPRRATPTSH